MENNGVKNLIKVINYDELVGRISYFRSQKSYSARQLSLELGKNSNYINLLESRKFCIPVDVLLEIFEILNVSPQEFFADNYRTYKADNELINLIKKLPNDKKQNLIEFLKK